MNVYKNICQFYYGRSWIRQKLHAYAAIAVAVTVVALCITSHYMSNAMETQHTDSCRVCAFFSHFPLNCPWAEKRRLHSHWARYNTPRYKTHEIWSQKFSKLFRKLPLDSIINHSCVRMQFRLFVLLVYLFVVTYEMKMIIRNKFTNAGHCEQITQGT